MACVTKLPDPEKIISEASALQRAAALDEYGEDVASYSKRLDEKPADCATLCNRAFCYVKLGKFEDARRDAEACIAADETFARGPVVGPTAIELHWRRVGRAFARSFRGIRSEERTQ